LGFYPSTILSLVQTILTRTPRIPFEDGSALDSRPSTPDARIIAHIDMDSYYASAETKRNPALKDKPVVIGPDPKEGRARGVVISCNYAARKYGLRSAMPISEAWRLCPGAVYLPPDFEYYESLSNEVMNIIRSRVKTFEQLSIDEAFVDLAGVVDSLGGARKWVTDLKEDLRIRTGLTCSVGLAETKTAAKIATDMHKPDGITVIGPGMVKETLAPLPVSVIPGVGVKTELILKEMGISKIADLQAVDVDVMKRRLGRSGVWLWEVGNGVEKEPVRQHELRSLSTERTFEKDTQEWVAVEELITELASELASRGQSAHIVFRKVGIKIRFRGFETHTREARLATHSNDRNVLEREALTLLHEFREKKLPVRLVGLRISELKSETADQSSMTNWIEKKGEG
jgi:DNA polymerase IV (archaeal DinB-like DNA polymerase)